MTSGDAFTAGLQTERTALAWSRTALGLLTNGALLVIGRLRAGRPGISDGLAGLALMLGLAFALASRRRARELRRAPQPVPLAVPGRVLALGTAVSGYCLLTGIALLL